MGRSRSVARPLPLPGTSTTTKGDLLSGDGVVINESSMAALAAGSVPGTRLALLAHAAAACGATYTYTIIRKIQTNCQIVTVWRQPPASGQMAPVQMHTHRGPKTPTPGAWRGEQQMKHAHNTTISISRLVTWGRAHRGARGRFNGRPCASSHMPRACIGELHRARAAVVPSHRGVPSAKNYLKVNRPG